LNRNVTATVANMRNDGRDGIGALSSHDAKELQQQQKYEVIEHLGFKA